MPRISPEQCYDLGAVIDFDQIGKYKVTGKLGQGSFGVVYRGRDAYIKRDVAIKVCSVEDEGLRKRFFREAEISGKLVHKNIVTVYEFGFEGGIPYLVQEMLSGEDLSRMIKRRDPIVPAVKLDYLLQVANGLGYAHTEGVIHRDIKPGNIRGLEDGRIKIMDFGIAKLASAETQLTQKGVTMGTASYLPPEQVRGAALDHRADIFSFGVLAYELLTYERPFRGNTLSALIYQILYKIPRSMSDAWSDCPAQLSELVGKCLEKKPERRFSSFAELIPELDAIRADVLAGRWPALQAVAAPTTDGQSSIVPNADEAREQPAAGTPDKQSDVLSQAAIAQTARGVLEGKVGEYTISTAASPQEILHPGPTEPGHSTRPVDARPVDARPATPPPTEGPPAAGSPAAMPPEAPPPLPAPAADAALKTRVLPTTAHYSAPEPVAAPPPVSAPEEESADLTIKAKQIIDMVAQGKLEAEAAKEQLEATIGKQDLAEIPISAGSEKPAARKPLVSAPPVQTDDITAKITDGATAKTRPMRHAPGVSPEAAGAALGPPEPPPEAAKSDTYRTVFRPPLGGLKWAGIATAVVAVAAIGWLLLPNRDDAPIEPAPEPPAAVAIVQPAGTEQILGGVAINALPWAELTEITDADGYVQELPRSVHTPLYIELPPGRYLMHLQAPEGTEVHTCDLEVTIDAVASCAPVFGEPSVTEYFKETGWWL